MGDNYNSTTTNTSTNTSTSTSTSSRTRPDQADGITDSNDTNINSVHGDPLGSAMDALRQEKVPITGEQRFALYFYAGIVLVGQVTSWIGTEPSYFSQKKNLFNVYFVKKAWFWTTLVYVAFIIGSKMACKKSSRYLGSVSQIVARYAAATFWWVLFAQWFFGLPIMDRVFLLSGGNCEGLADTIVREGKSISSAACKRAGGQWIGGHDPSGHVFLLVHSSLFLLFEMLPYLMAESRPKLGPAHKAGLAILGLWAWMLLMTSIYFHSFTEKLVGLIWAYGQVVFVYVFARDTRLGQVIFG